MLIVGIRLSISYVEIKDPVLSSFYTKLESCYDKTEDYNEERVKSTELTDESVRVRDNILTFITSSEISTLGEAHCDSKNRTSSAPPPSTSDPSSTSSSTDDEDSDPSAKKRRMNEEHDSAFEEPFDSDSDEVSLADVLQKV